MDESTEKKVLNSLYDRLFQAVTYAPEGKQNSAFTKDRVFLQFSQNQALNPADYENVVSPTNPKGDLGASQAFANLVDQMPSQTSSYSPSSTLISQTYKAIVDGANSTVKPDPEQEKRYKEAFDYLNTSSTIKDFRGKEISQTDHSAIYKQYLDNQTAYISAISGYRTAYLGYDLTKTDQQRQWQANEPKLNNIVDQTYNAWRSQGSAQVEEALSVLASAINDAVGNAIRNAQQTMSSGMASSTGDGSSWYFSYPIPSNFADPKATGFAEFTLSSDYLEESSENKVDTWGAKGSGDFGLFSFSASASGSHADEHRHCDASQFDLKAEIAVVRVFRPWLNELIFKMNNWYTNMSAAHGIATGKMSSDMLVLPLIPTAFVVARNVSISANWSTDDKKHVADAMESKASVGWGPFSLGGDYSNSSSSDYHKATLDGGTYKMPGIQIIAWVNELTPDSPQLGGPSPATGKKIYSKVKKEEASVC
ncbi:MAG: hypothetical protein QS721_05880 [Candidatus Endonucleobacter sp. (ex Gigantidas childressi)]|nr:hypothetical protein [Candidatus Endonucleobacter sp. (ex Gigantidas childressi)]